MPDFGNFVLVFGHQTHYRSHYNVIMLVFALIETQIIKFTVQGHSTVHFAGHLFGRPYSLQNNESTVYFGNISAQTFVTLISLPFVIKGANTLLRM